MYVGNIAINKGANRRSAMPNTEQKPLIMTLIDERVIRCPNCHSILHWTGRNTQCQECYTSFKCKNGAIDLYGRYKEQCSDKVVVSNRFVEDVAKSLGFSNDEGILNHIADAVRDTYLLSIESDSLTAEIRELAMRLKIPPPIGPSKNLERHNNVLPNSNILRFCLVHECVRWIEDNVLDIPVEVTEKLHHSLEDLPIYCQDFDFDSDQDIAKQMISSHTNKNHQNKNLFCFIACDALNIPFATASFDGCVIFAALHHFPDPVNLLLYLKKIVKKDGFFAIKRELCNPNPCDPDYLRDFRTGVNEQMRSIEEYSHISDEARLKLHTGRIDSKCSLKDILEPHDYKKGFGDEK